MLYCGYEEFYLHQYPYKTEFICQSAGTPTCSSTQTTKAKQSKGCDAKLKGLTPTGYGSQLPKGVYMERERCAQAFFCALLQ